jgi:hypothetical protein
MSDVIEDLHELGEETATEALPLELDRRMVGRVRARQTMTVLASATLVAASVVGVLVAMGSLDHPATSASVTSSAGTPSPTSGASTIFLDPPENTESFAPPGDAQPKLTWSEAVAAFQVVDPVFKLPADATAQLGLYTAAVGDGTYRYKDRLAWGLSWHQCAAPRHELPADTVVSCTAWLFLDANTGAMLEAEWQLDS